MLWRKVLEGWGNDYGFLRSNTVRRYLQPRGIPALMGGLAAIGDVRYAVTGSVVAQKMGTMGAAPFSSDLHG